MVMGGEVGGPEAHTAQAAGGGSGAGAQVVSGPYMPRPAGGPADAGAA